MTYVKRIKSSILNPVSMKHTQKHS